jgi:tRNA wybutosine-synthesizing protein 3
MNIERDFYEGKKIALEKLNNAKKNNEVDLGILPILDIINESDKYYTSSSCFGRIVILEIPKIGNKKEAKFLGKWHKPIEFDELSSVFKKAKKGQLWILAQSPIIHIVVKNLDSADELLKIAYSAGFKHSGFKSVENRFIVEVCSTERLDSPIGKDGTIYCNDKHLRLLVDISNEIIDKSTKKLYKFEQKIRKHLSTHKSTN